MAYKSRKPEFIDHPQQNSFSSAIKIAKTQGLDYLTDYISQVESLVNENDVDNLWDYVRETPYRLATRQNEFIVQIIDEFQFLNSEICRGKDAEKPITDFAAGYLRTAKFKNAPLLVSGSWVGWLSYDLIMMLPGRFTLSELPNMPEDEAVEMAFKHSQIYDVPITEETAYLIADISEGNPFYISSFFHSARPDKDLTTRDGLTQVLEFETLNDEGIVKGTWMEYFRSALGRINERYAKLIVFYLSKHRDREVTRKELLEKLKLDMDDFELEKKLKMLVKSDIIEQGRTNFDYRGVQDNIFDKVFRGVYQKEIESYDEKEITGEYLELFKQSERKYRKLLGKMNQMKGAYAEYLIIRQLRHHAYLANERFCAMLENHPSDFRFVEYETVWTYRFSPVEKRDFEIDVFARASEGEYSIVGKVKKRRKKYSESEAIEFLKKIKELQETEKIKTALGFVFSTSGFTKGCVKFFQKHGIAWSSDMRWLDV